MNYAKRTLMTVALTLCAWSTSELALASPLYDNLQTPLGVYIGGFGPYGEIADDITMSGGGAFTSARVAYGATGFDGNETLTLNLYAMDGAPNAGSFGSNTPSTLLYTQTVALDGSGFADFVDATPSVVLPATLGVGLVFGGVAFNVLTSDAGPSLYSPPAIGSSLPHYWLKGYNNDPNWARYDFGGQPPADFGLRIEAAPVPEPGGLALLGLAGLAVARSRKQ